MATLNIYELRAHLNHLPPKLGSQPIAVLNTDTGYTHIAQTIDAVNLNGKPMITIRINNKDTP